MIATQASRAMLENLAKTLDVRIFYFLRGRLYQEAKLYTTEILRVFSMPQLLSVAGLVLDLVIRSRGALT